MRGRGAKPAAGEPRDEGSRPVRPRGRVKGGVGQINHDNAGRPGHEASDTGTDPFADVRARRRG